ncbi:MAG: hypothetical protein ABJA98_17590 [Acidobacteriota bacterium]
MTRLLETGEKTDLESFALAGSRQTAARRGIWDQSKDDILADWINQHPGTRPAAWWDFDAPLAVERSLRLRDLPTDHREPRRRVGGRGTLACEVLAIAPAFAFGLSRDFIDAFQVAYYNGLAVDIDGKRIGTEYRAGGFVADAFDPHDPPRFESQAAYLERHGLLTPREAARLTSRDFEPEAIIFQVDGDEAPDVVVGRSTNARGESHERTH